MQNEIITAVPVAISTTYVPESTKRFAHALRTTLSIVQLYTELLEQNCDRQRSPQNRAMISSYVRHIKKAMRESSELISEFLQV
jgi:hypothetical protein